MSLSQILVIYFLLCFGFVYIFHFCNDNLQWKDVSVDQIAGSKFISTSGMFIIRGLISLIIWGSIYHIYTDKKGLSITVVLLDNSKRPLLLKHAERLTMFTVWSWIMQGFYFAGATICSGLYMLSGSHQNNTHLEILILNTLKVGYEISFPVAFIVSLIVSFILIPAAKRLTGSADNFFAPMALLFHNANVIFMVFEMIFNKIPLHLWHLPFILIYGMSYSIFAWYWNWKRGFYYYFFMDYHRPDAIYWYVGLMVGISAFYLIAYGLSFTIFQYESNILPYAVVLLLAWISMRFKD